MKIKRLEYYDDEYKWKLEPVDFHPNLNLLVGVSGAGKTRTLDAINQLKLIANGASLNGVEWNVCFQTEDNSEYRWCGKFETREKDTSIDIETDLKEKKPVKIISEKLIKNEEILINRRDGEILFDSKKTPKLSPYESVIELFEEEEIVIPVRESIDKIMLSDFEPDSFNGIWGMPASIFKQYQNTSLASLRESGLPIPIKLAILYRALPQEFNRIKESFINIFPNVLDLQAGTVEDFHLPISFLNIMKDLTTISIKEKGIDNWVTNASSGMRKTLMYISELYLLPESSLILIDEFENSLGINCLDSVMELITSNRNSQFIITSHHPYIINNISPANWKIVTRHGSSVTVKNAKDFHISDSRQKAFIDLINVLEDDDSED
jgi:ABC-type dipeptide/oligopeptide/nickel transport system ATPase component